MAEQMKVLFLTLSSREVVAVFRTHSHLSDREGYWCYPSVDEGNGSVFAWSSRLSTPEEYAPLKTRLEAQGFNLEICQATSEPGGRVAAHR
jgi:hypothetical protein